MGRSTISKLIRIEDTKDNLYWHIQQTNIEVECIDIHIYKQLYTAVNLQEIIYNECNLETWN